MVRGIHRSVRTAKRMTIMSLNKSCPMFFCDRFLLDMTDMGNEFLQDVQNDEPDCRHCVGYCSVIMTGIV